MKFQLSGPPAVLPHSRKKLQSSDVGVASRPPFFPSSPAVKVLSPGEVL